MTIPMVDLRPMLAATEPAWRANLERLFGCMQFILGEQVDCAVRGGQLSTTRPWRDAKARGPSRGGLPVAEQACREVLSLPLGPYMPGTAVEQVAARVRELYSEA